MRDILDTHNSVHCNTSRVQHYQYYQLRSYSVINFSIYFHVNSILVLLMIQMNHNERDVFQLLTPFQSLLFAAGLRPTPAQATAISWVKIY